MRFPGLLASVAIGALLLAAALAAPTLYLGSIREDALRQEVAEVTRFGAGLDFSFGSRFRTPFDPHREEGQLWERIDRGITKRLDPEPFVGDGIFTIMGSPVPIATEQAPGKERNVRLVYRAGVITHLQVIEGSKLGDGIWLAEADARILDVGVGDRIEVGFAEHREAVVVTGIYKELYNLDEVPFWRNYTEEIFAPVTASSPQPTFAFATREKMVQLEHEIGESSAEFRWQFPLETDPPPTYEEAVAVERMSNEVTQELNNPRSDLVREMRCVDGCFGQRRAGYATGGFSTLMDSVLQQTRARVIGLKGPTGLLSTAGVLVALAVVAAVGAFTVAARRVEAAFLHARGMSPRTVGIKTALESLIPVVIGAAAGLFLASRLIDAIGPSRVEGSSADSALRGAVASILLAIVCIGLVAMASYRHRSLAAGGIHRRIVPFEPLLFAGAVVCLVRILQGHGLVAEGEGISRPSIYLLLFPILFLAGGGAMATRALTLPLRRLTARSGAAPARYLATHRLAGAKRLAILLVSACALALGIFVFSQTMVASFDASVSEKAGVFVGSDVQAQVTYETVLPGDFPYPATKVTKMAESARLGHGGVQVDVLAVDPTTIAAAAYWDKSFGGSLDDLAAKLGRSGEGPLPVVVAGGQTTAEALDYGEGDFSVPIEVVGTVGTFPGMSVAHPLVVVPREPMDEILSDAEGINPLRGAGASNEVWARGPTDQVVDALTKAVRPYDFFTVREVKEHPTIETVTRTFGFLEAIGLGAAVLVVVGILMYLQARQRSRIVSYSLARRMGLTRREHRIAVVLEIAAMLLGALAVALLLAVVAGWLVHGEIDPLPKLAGGALFRFPTTSSVGALVVLAVVSIAGGLVASRITEKANVARVMRLAE